MGFPDSNPRAKSGSDSASLRVLQLSDDSPFKESGSEPTSLLQNVAKKLVEHEQSLLHSHALKLKQKENEIDELKKVNLECMKKIKVYKKKFLVLDERVFILEEMAKDFKSGNLEDNNNKQQKDFAAPDEIRIQPLSSEKGDLRVKKEPECQDIIKVDDEEDEDDDDGQYISILKRKRLPSDIKKDHNSDDIDLDGMSALKAKRASKEINRDCNSDYVDNNLAATRKGNDPEDLHKQPITSQPLPTPYRAEMKPKHLTSSFNTCNSSPGQNIEKVDEALKSVIAKLRKPKERWESEAAMLEEFDKDDELCLNAMCALHRQKVRFQVYDILRITYLATMLINGDPQQKLRKRASELRQFDLDHCRMFPKQYSSHLFDIYQKKVDPFFPASEQ